MTDDPSNAIFNPFMGQIAFMFPQGGGKARAYFGCRADVRHPPAGRRRLREVHRAQHPDGRAGRAVRRREAGRPRRHLRRLDSWVEHPYKDGIALVGDAAQTSDQTWGQGLSITMHDARQLRDALLATDDWEAAGHKYAEAANECFQHIRRVEDWMTLLMMDQSDAANAARSKTLPRLAVMPASSRTRTSSAPNSHPPTKPPASASSANRGRVRQAAAAPGAEAMMDPRIHRPGTTR